MYASLVLISWAIDLRKESDKNLKIALRRYKKGYEWHICLAQICLVAEYIYVDRPPLFRLAVERSTAEG